MDKKDKISKDQPNQKAERQSELREQNWIPNEAFLDSALPGFKQTLNARRSIRIYDGKRKPEGLYGPRVRFSQDRLVKEV